MFVKRLPDQPRCRILRAEAAHGDFQSRYLRNAALSVALNASSAATDTATTANTSAISRAVSKYSFAVFMSMPMLDAVCINISAETTIFILKDSADAKLSGNAAAAYGRYSDPNFCARPAPLMAHTSSSSRGTVELRAAVAEYRYGTMTVTPSMTGAKYPPAHIASMSEIASVGNVRSADKIGSAMRLNGTNAEHKKNKRKNKPSDTA